LRKEERRRKNGGRYKGKAGGGGRALERIGERYLNERVENRRDVGRAGSGGDLGGWGG